MVSVNQKQKCVIANRFAFKVRNVGGVAAQQHPKTANKRRRPFFLAHLVAPGVEPHHILDLGAANPPPLQKFRPAENRVIFSQLDQATSELEKTIAMFVTFPAEPADLIILTIRIVVSVLRTAEFVP